MKPEISLRQIRNSELRSRPSVQQSDTLRRGANNPQPETDRLFLPDGSKTETDHPPTNRFAISYGKRITLFLHFDASPQAASHNVRSTFHIGEANISRRSHFTFAQQIFHVAQQHI